MATDHQNLIIKNKSMFVEFLKKSGLPSSIILMFLFIIFIMNNHRDERAEDKVYLMAVNKTVIEVVKENTAALTNLSTLIKSR